MTAVDRPDNGQDEGRELDAVVQTIAAMYRDPEVARYAMNDLRDWLSGDREAPSTAVRAALRAANPLCCADHQAHMCPACVVRCHEQQQPARWVTLPGDDRQHASGGNCPCGPVQVGQDAWEHR